MKPHPQKTYLKPQITTLDSAEIVEAMGPAHGGASGPVGMRVDMPRPELREGQGTR